MWEEHGIEEAALLEKLSAKKVPKQFRTHDDIRNWIGDCHRCALAKGRNKLVFGTGNPQAELMFVGEGPGADEDAQGLPFVGRAGQLLTKIIEAMDLTRDAVYIANIVKCRPPNNRVPEPAEVAACLPFLKAQVQLVRPRLIVALGLTAATTLTGKTTTLSNLRGTFQSLVWNETIPVLSTYHPAYLLRNQDAKKIVWEDMKLVIKRLKECL